MIYTGINAAQDLEKEQMKYFYPLIVLILLVNIRLFAAEADIGFFMKQKQFVQDLFQQGQYFDSIAETRRLLQIAKTNVDRNDCLYFINLNYYLGKQYKTVIFNMSSMKTGIGFRERLLLGYSYFKMGRNEDSIKNFNVIDYRDVDSSSAYDLLLGKVEVYLHSSEYGKILNEIDMARGSSLNSSRLDILSREIENHSKIKLKSVALSVALSAIVPGAGQIYSGKYLSGILSFVGVAATAAGAYFCYLDGKKDFAYMLVAFSGVFYMGNIYGAYNSARSMNANLHQRFRDDIKGRFIGEYDPVKRFKGL